MQRQVCPVMPAFLGIHAHDLLQENIPVSLVLWAGIFRHFASRRTHAHNLLHVQPIAHPKGKKGI